MNQLKKELGLIQGIGLLSTSLLGTGVFAVPAMAAQLAQGVSLWAWPILLLLVFPIAIGFASLGRYYPSAGGAAHFVQLAFGAKIGRVTGWLFLSVIPVGLPVALSIAAGFWFAAFGLSGNQLLLVQFATLLTIWLLGLRSSKSSGYVQTLIALLIITMVVAIWYKADTSIMDVAWPAWHEITLMPLFNALAVMFWCFVGLEAFVHLTSEFRHPKRDFPRALLVGLLLAGLIYWACTAAVLTFHVYSPDIEPSASLPMIMVQLFGANALWIACIIGYLACFASINIYSQSFARLVWSQAEQYKPNSWLARLSTQQVPVNALSVVVLASAISLLLAHFVGLSLEMLITYANGVFVLIYLLCMLAGWYLLKGKAKIMCLLGALVSLLLLLIIGWQSLYALVMFVLLWGVAKRRSL